VVGCSRRVWICGLLFLAAAPPFPNLRHGRALYAIGGNKEAARAAGIRVDRTVWVVMIIGSMLAALSGVFYTGHYGAIAADQGKGWIFQVSRPRSSEASVSMAAAVTVFGALTGILTLQLVLKCDDVGRCSGHLGGFPQTERSSSWPDHLPVRVRREAGVGVVMALTDEAIDKIKAMIISGEFPSGSRLPKEDDLAQLLGLSRSSLREAVRALTAMRILVTKQGERHVRVEPRAASLPRGDVLRVRRVAESHRAATSPGKAAARTAGHGPGRGRIVEDDLKDLREILDQSLATGSVEEFVRHDVAFHSRIVDVVGNPVLSMLLQVMSTKTQRLRILRGTQTHQALRVPTASIAPSWTRLPHGTRNWRVRWPRCTCRCGTVARTTA